MAFYLDNTLYFDFYLNGQQIPLTLDNIESLVIVSNAYDMLPTLRAQILDTKALFQRGLLSDGTIFSIAIGSDADNAQKNKMDFFLASSPEEEKSLSKDTYLIYGTLNFPKFWRCCSPIGINGTSKQALQTLATSCGLKFSGVDTQDSMLWMNGTKNYGQFSKEISNYGWIYNESCMVSTVDLSGALLYKDVNVSKPKYILTDIDNPQVDYLKYDEVTYSNRASKNNFTYGYENRLVQYDLKGNRKLYTSVDFTKQNSAVLNISKKMYDATGLVRNTILPQDLGNVHSNWAQADYQNSRFKALNSIEGSFYFNKRTPLSILDTIGLSVIDPITKQPDTVKAGLWTITAQTLAISKQTYVEKIVAETTGLDLDLFNNLI